MSSLVSSLALWALLTARAQGAYTLVRDMSGDTFFDNFNFQNASDPTNGYVNYLNQEDAVSQGLAKVVNGQVYVGADSTNRASDPGRNSVRLEAKESFTNGLLIADIAHMPGGACGIWPAFWTFNFDMDPYGEIDIIEGQMHDSTYPVSLHTCGTCSFNVPGDRQDCNLGGQINEGCPDASVTNADGCGVTSPANTYGDAWNKAGGGVYATQVTSSSVKIWTWYAANVPSDITAGNPDPTKWGTPFANLVGGSGCDVAHYFKKQSLIINIDFCGDNIDTQTWRGDSLCPKTTNCSSYVRDNPKAFKEAYWLFNSVRLYQ